MELSIIIPMYNAASSIERCLVSTQRQNIAKTDYEVIVINDGSTDNSLEVANGVASRYSNIQLYSQENGGLSRARNAGLDKAKGDYIFFLDSDDSIAENCLEKIISKCKEHNLDILRICAANVIDGVPKRRFTLNEDKGISLFNISSDIFAILTVKEYSFSFSINTIYVSSPVSFTKIMNSHHVFTILQNVLQASTISFILFIRHQAQSHDLSMSRKHLI